MIFATVWIINIRDTLERLEDTLQLFSDENIRQLALIRKVLAMDQPDPDVIDEAFDSAFDSIYLK